MEVKSSSQNLRERDLNSSKFDVWACVLIEVEYLLHLSSTFRMNCPAELKFRSSEDGQSLVCTSINGDHNHEISEV